MEKRKREAEEAEAKAAEEAKEKSSSSSVISEELSVESELKSPKPKTLRDLLEHNKTTENPELVRTQTLLKKRGF